MTNKFKKTTDLLGVILLMSVGFTMVIAMERDPTERRTTTHYSLIQRANRLDVKPGKWGGTGISVVVESDEVAIAFDCGNARIGRSLRTTKSGRFTLTGTYTPQSHGPIRINMLPKPRPASFIGRVVGKKMTLTIRLTDTNEIIGSFTLERGKESKMHQCR